MTHPAFALPLDLGKKRDSPTRESARNPQLAKRILIGLPH